MLDSILKLVYDAQFNFDGIIGDSYGSMGTWDNTNSGIVFRWG